MVIEEFIWPTSLLSLFKNLHELKSAEDLSEEGNLPDPIRIRFAGVSVRGGQSGVVWICGVHWAEQSQDVITSQLRERSDASLD